MQNRRFCIRRSRYSKAINLKPLCKIEDFVFGAADTLKQ